MIETITPAGCRGRNRYRLALVFFTVGALVAAAIVGALLGLLGGALGAPRAVLVVAVLAAVGAAREAGIVRLPLPQLRLQVPERWHRDLPLPVWTAGYGAGLGVGFATFQPVATFWIAVAAALVVGSPFAAAVCFSVYGLGRALMVVAPPRPANVTAVVEALAARRPLLKRANAVALAACAILLALAPVAGASDLELGPGQELDPSRSGRVLAYTKRVGDDLRVIVRVSATELYTYPGESPSLDGPYLAYAGGGGVHVVRWETGEEVASIANVSKPALDWPRLVFRHDLADGTKRLVLRTLETGAATRLGRFGAGVDVGRPAIAGPRIAWHRAALTGSAIFLYRTDTGRRFVWRQSKIALYSYPALTTHRIVWVEQRMARTYVRTQWLGGGPTKTPMTSARRSVRYWTTAVAGRTIYATRWKTATGVAVIERKTL